MFAPPTSPPVPGPPPVVRPAGPARTSARDGALDVIRAIAVARVVVWHTLGVAAITWFVAAVPAMFFVTGSLLARSFDRRRSVSVVAQRLRRLLVPFWAYGLVVLAISAVGAAWVAGPGGEVPVGQLWRWVVPLADPLAPAWTEGWLTTSLWYVRTLTWLTLLAPLLVGAVRRAPCVVVAAAFAGVVATDVVPRHLATPAPVAGAAWFLGDLCLYGLFLVLGVLDADGSFARWRPRRYVALALGAAGATALWALTQPVPGWVANDSHPAHLGVGLTWLALGLAVRGRLGKLVSVKVAGTVVRFVGQRSYTIYLWHPLAAILTYRLLWSLDPAFPVGGHVVAVLGGTVAATLALVALTGWVEDLAAGRPARWWPSTRSSPAPLRVRVRPVVARRAAVGLGAGIIVVAAVQPVAVARPVVVATVPRAPSQAPPRPAFTPAPDQPGSPSAGVEVLGTPEAVDPVSPDAVATTTSTVPAGGAVTAGGGAVASPAARAATPAAPDPRSATPAAPAVRSAAPAVPATKAPAPAPGPPPATTVPAVPRAELVAQLTARLDAQLAAVPTSLGIPGAIAAVSRPGVVAWSGAVGTIDGTPRRADEAFQLWSATKLVTAVLMYRAVDRGQIDLDAPLPRLQAAPAFDANRFTARQLLAHRSGLVNYRAAAAYLRDPGSIVTPAEAVTAANDEPLLFTPGTATNYSSTDYLVLGLLLEQRTGRTFDRLVADLAAEVGMRSTQVAAPVPANPNHATAGVVSTTADLVALLTAVFRDRSVLSEASYRSLVTIDRLTAMGAGAWGLCPCTTDSAGTARFAAVGRPGSGAILAYVPASDVVVVLDVQDLWNAPGRYSAASEVVARLAASVDAVFGPPPVAGRPVVGV